MSELNGRLINGNGAVPNGLSGLARGHSTQTNASGRRLIVQASRLQELAVQAAEALASASTEDEIERARKVCSGIAQSAKAVDLCRARVRIEQGKADPGPFKSPGPTKSRKPRGQIKPIGPAEPETPAISPPEVPKP